jgi:hypothetical protein
MFHELYVGDWGFVLRNSYGECMRDSGYNVGSELANAIDGLTEIPEGDKVFFYSEDAYFVNAINKWCDYGWYDGKNDHLRGQERELLDVLDVEAYAVRHGDMKKAISRGK